VLSNVPDVEQRQDDSLVKDDVERGLKFYDWSGAPPPPVEEGPEKPPDLEPVKESVASLLKIRGIRFDGDEPERSEVIFKYKSTAMITSSESPDGTFLKRTGDHLDGRLAQIKVAAIYSNVVEFAFDDEPGREHEYVAPEGYDLGASFARVVAGETPASRRTDISKFVTAQRNASGPPLESLRISPTKIRLGTEDVQNINDNFAEILTTEISIDRHRDPTTKRYDGIQIKGVKPGSIADRHGVMDGDVIKSINGHPVSSKEEAITFVKNNKDVYDRWEVEIWNKGQTRTMTYYPPNK
jgi:hypothetical protein